MLTFATVGTGWITSSFIEAALSGAWKFIVAYSREIKKAADLINKYAPGSATPSDDFNAIADLKPDAVYIASPNSLHCGQSLYFLSRGINVIVEKPAAVSIEEWAAMEKTAAENGAFILEAFRHINSPGFEALKNAVAQIGPVRNAILSYNQYSSKYESFLRGESPNVFSADFAGGAMNDLGVYPISLAAALWGMPKKIRGAAYFLPGAEKIKTADGAGSLILDYGSFLCNITFSKVSDGIIESEIIGEDGGVSFDRPQELSKIILRPRVKSDKPKTKLSEFGKNAAESIDYSAALDNNKMNHEAKAFADIIMKKSGYEKKYAELLKISRDTHAIMDAARREFL